MKTLLIGEAWGTREERFQHALVGPSGAELARMLSETKIAPGLGMSHPSELDMMKHWRWLREHCEIDIGNVFNFHPPNNNIEECFCNQKEGGLTTLPPLKPGKYLRPPLLASLEALWSLVEQSRPNLVVAMGNTACWALLGEAKIGTLRGTVKKSPKLGVKVLPTYHPAAVLRQWNLRTIVLSDLEKARLELEFPEIRRIERYVTVEPSLREIAEWMERPADYYAVDIETYRATISMIGFARSANDALVIPFYDERKDTGSYWCPTDETVAWRLVDTLLKKPIPKIFQNGIYDLTYLLRVGLRPVMCNGDTMLLSHALYPEMLKGLGFLGSIYANEQAWKQMRQKGDNLKRDE